MDNPSVEVEKERREEIKVKGQEKKSRQYESQILAENAMFEFRKGLESPKSKKQLDHWQLSLLSSSVRMELIVVEGRNQQRTDVHSTGNHRRKAGRKLP
jgi:hypothetical protein